MPGRLDTCTDECQLCLCVLQLPGEAPAEAQVWARCTEDQCPAYTMTNESGPTWESTFLKLCIESSGKLLYLEITNLGCHMEKPRWGSCLYFPCFAISSLLQCFETIWGITCHTRAARIRT